VVGSFDKRQYSDGKQDAIGWKIQGSSIEMHRYTLGRSIGEGAFGDVHLAYNNETGDRVGTPTSSARTSANFRNVFVPMSNFTT
jgi:serine/threonine protein kinase